MSDTNQPTVKPFRYVCIPCDASLSVEEMHFDGHSEGELRRTLTRYFRQSLLSVDQQTAMGRHLMEKANEGTKKHAVKNGTPTEVTPASAQQQAEMIDRYLDEASYEIVPVTMPMRSTQYIGTSLYIDDSGSFKDLPLNSRASQLAQRDIRGDAFLLSNHDDPAIDEWGRVDCLLERYEELLASPPQTAYDTSNQAQMTRAAMLRESEAKAISMEDYAKACVAKEDGNQLFAAGDMAAALQAYSMTVDLTEGRRDLLPDEAAADRLRLSALLNRCFCLTKLRRFNEAVIDAQRAITMAPSSTKAAYRLTYALCGTQEYEAATQACETYQKLGGTEEDVQAMRAAIASGEVELTKSRKAIYSKMFR